MTSESRHVRKTTWTHPQGRIKENEGVVPKAFALAILSTYFGLSDQSLIFKAPKSTYNFPVQVEYEKSAPFNWVGWRSSVG